MTFLFIGHHKLKNIGNIICLWFGGIRPPNEVFELTFQNFNHIKRVLNGCGIWVDFVPIKVTFILDKEKLKEETIYDALENPLRIIFILWDSRSNLHRQMHQLNH